MVGATAVGTGTSGGNIRFAYWFGVRLGAVAVAYCALATALSGLAPAASLAGGDASQLQLCLVGGVCHTNGAGDAGAAAVSGRAVAAQKPQLQPLLAIAVCGAVAGRTVFGVKQKLLAVNAGRWRDLFSVMAAGPGQVKPLATLAAVSALSCQPEPVYGIAELTDIDRRSLSPSE